jgi:hypothetical protein
VRYPYKLWPLKRPHPAFPDERHSWIPILNVRIAAAARPSQTTNLFEAVVDSGSADTLFHTDIAQQIGIAVDSGIAAHRFGGVVEGQGMTVYFHDVHLHVGSDIIKIRAGFSDRLSIAALLGRRGFFEHFIVTFDSAPTPPEMEIQRLARV